VGFDSSGHFIYASLPVGPGLLGLDYSPSSGDSIIAVSGDATFFTSDSFFSLSVAPGFAADANPGVELIAPPPGGGLDAMIFTGIENAHVQGFGSFEIFAPNGTLTTTLELPSNLDAFQNYARDHTGDTFEFTPGYGPDFPMYPGEAVFGVLWVAPEPSSIVPMTMGVSVALCLTLGRRRRLRWNRLSAAGAEAAR
jgi:hypothetical protein